MRVTHAQVEQKVTQVNRSAMAKQLGLDRSYVSQVLARRRMPGLDVAAGIARNMGVSIDALHGWLTRESTMVN